MRAHAFVLALALRCDSFEEVDARPQAATKEQTVAETWLPSEEECSQCHDVIAEQWARSRHHSSFQNPDFARSWAREPLAFCRDCHAPALQRLPPLPDAEAESLGVGCLDCHLEGNTLVTSGSPKEASAAPHALRKSPEFATQSCARCHEFAFPAKTWRPAGTLMQLTMTEHAASQHASRSCSECHMQGHDHSFASTRDPEAMRRALEVAARRKGSALELDLTPVGVGHAFPTGDLYRRLEVHAELVSAEGEQLATATRYLARHFEPRRRPDGRLNYAARLPTPDNRLRGPTTLRLELGLDAPQAAMIWWVDYERVDDRDSHAPERSTLADEIRLAHGRL